MPTIDEIAERVEPVTPQASVACVYNWFSAHPDALALPVVVDGRPVGLIDRQDFLFKLAEPLGHSRYGSRPIEHIMDSEPAVVEYDANIRCFTDIILKSSAGTLMRGFIVTRKGQYLGVGTVISLLHLANSAQVKKLEEQEAEIAALKSVKANSPEIADAAKTFVELVQRELDIPLRSITALTGLLSRLPLPAMASEHVEAILSAAQDGTEALERARDLIHLEHGELELNKEPVLVRTFVDQIASTWTSRGTTDGVSIIVSYDGDNDLSAMMDKVRFNQTVNTLIETSLRLVRNGIIEVGVKAEAVKDAINISVRIRDDGPGLEADQIDNLFSQSNPYGSISLSSAGKLMKLLNGSIWAENNAGRGATYGLDVSVTRHIAQDANAENVSRIQTFAQNARPHVLIADDNATNCVVAQALCEMFGCTCETVENGREAVEAIRLGHFDLVLMDIKMPKMDGVQATRTIRSMGIDGNTLPIIALTANADPDDAASYIEAGMMCVVEKPIKPERLHMAIAKACAKQDCEPQPQLLKQVS